MAHETQKAKIERLEATIKKLEQKADALFKENNEYYDKIMALQADENSNFINSPAYKQMLEKNSLLETEVDLLRKNLDVALLKINAQISMIERLQEQTLPTLHNARGAGRKPKFSDEQTAHIKAMHRTDISMAKIAREMNCSVGLVHKIIHETNNRL